VRQTRTLSTQCQRLTRKNAQCSRRIDRAGDRLGERDVSTQRVSEVETDKEMSAMMRDYDVVHSEGEDERSPPKLELAHEYREYVNKTTHSPILRHTLPSPPTTSPPHHTMDISSVRFQPVPVKAQVEMTSTYGHPRLNWPEKAKENDITTCLRFASGSLST